MIDEGSATQPGAQDGRNLEDEIVIDDEPADSVKDSGEKTTAEQKATLPELPKSVYIDDEEVPAPDADIVVGWRDIVEAEANDSSRVAGIEEQVSDMVTAKYHFAVLSNLRQEIGIAKQGNITSKELYKKIALRYHPDLYSGMDDLTKSLTSEYFKALGSLRDNNEL